MQKNLILQLAYGKNLSRLKERPDWFPKVQDITIEDAWYQLLFNCLGKNLDSLNVTDGTTNEENHGAEVWGNFNQYSSILKKMEQHVGEMGAKFVFNGKMDFAVEDDKLCHSSQKFRGLGLQMSGFCGSCIGPVSHAIAGVQTGFIHAIRLGCIRENVSTIGQNLFKSMDYGQSEDMRNKLDAQVMID